MTDPQVPKPKRRWIALGEMIALLALVVSALGLWNSWRRNEPSRAGPTEVIERKTAVPLVLQGKIEDGGKRLAIAPVEDGHALQSLVLAVPGGGTIEAGSDGTIRSDQLELAAEAQNPKRDDDGWLPVTVTARYVETGIERTATRPYRVGYRWEGGGLFSGKALRFTGLRSA